MSNDDITINISLGQYSYRVLSGVQCGTQYLRHATIKFDEFVSVGVHHIHDLGNQDASHSHNKGTRLDFNCQLPSCIFSKLQYHEQIIQSQINILDQEYT